MSVEEENKVIARRVAEEVFNKRNMAIIPEIYASNVIFHAPGGEDLKGHEGIRQILEMLLAAFPDIHMTIDDMVAEGEKLAVRYTLSGTHQGSFMGVPPTGKQITWSGNVIARIVDGKEVEAWEALDRLSIMQQLGVSPPSQ